MNFKYPHPQVVVQMFPIDPSGHILVMRRSEKVRSARGVWSFPSGLHEVGERYEEGASRELMEEYNLETQLIRPVGVYENIDGDEPGTPRYHWFILLCIAVCEDLGKAINKEPDKHDVMKVLPIDKVILGWHEFKPDHPFHASFNRFMEFGHTTVYEKIQEALQHDRFV